MLGEPVQHVLSNNFKYIIVPNIYKNPVVKTDLISYQAIMKQADVIKLNQFLNSIQFVLYLKNYTFSTITYIDLEQVNIKHIIKRFYQQKYFDLISAQLDDRLLSIYVNTDTKSDDMIFYFELFNFYGEQAYTSFIEYHTKIKYDLFLNMRKVGVPVVYRRISISDKNIALCQNNPLYRIYQKYHRRFRQPSRHRAQIESRTESQVTVIDRSFSTRR